MCAFSVLVLGLKQNPSLFEHYFWRIAAALSNRRHFVLFLFYFQAARTDLRHHSVYRFSKIVSCFASSERVHFGGLLLD